MKNRLWELSKNHLLAIGIFLAISCIYCAPALKGLILNQHDTINWKQMSQQSFEFREKYGHFPLWTNSIFSGMPAFQIAMESKYNVNLTRLHSLFTLFLPGPAGLFFLSCIGFYILCVVLRTRTWISIMSSLAYAFASYSAVIVAVGHVTKFASMGYSPAVLAGLLLIGQKKYVLGFATTLLFTTLMVSQSHVQIVYYTLIIGGCMGVAWVVKTVRERDIKHLVSSLALSVASVAIGVIAFSVVLLPYYDYAAESMRGGRSELTDKVSSQNKTKGGLDKDYAFMWSYGKLETFTFAVPRIYGGSSGSAYGNELGNKSKTAEAFSRVTGADEEQANEFVQRFPTYWGEQPSTSGTVYFGAVICFLFILGLVLYRGWHLGWILAATFTGILLAWGKNLESLNYFLFDHLPFYSKFRAPTISLVIPQLTFPLLAALGLEQLVSYKEQGKIAMLWKKFKTAGIASLALIVILGGLYITLDYKGLGDARLRDGLAQQMLQQMSRGQQPTAEQQQQANEFGRSIVNGLVEDRRSMYGGDLMRTILFMALSAAVIALYIRDKIKTLPTLVILTILSFVDLIGVDLRYLSYRNYQEEEAFSEFVPTAADLAIKKDTTYYRVYDGTGGDPYQDSRASYFHNSVGGYHPAKLALYNDLIQNQLATGNMHVFNMLNTKYFIIANPANGQPVVQPNPDAYGAAWLVKSLKYVKNADEEMSSLNSLNTKDTAVLDQREQSKVPFVPQFDSTATIRLVQNLNDQINYEFSAPSNQFAVFSEIYYPRGWKAFVDGKETPIVKVDYLLRGLPLTAGKHTIEFRFEPRSVAEGEMISLITGIFSILALLYAFWYEWKLYRKKNETAMKK